MSSECIFCRIAAGEIPCAKLYESETILAFLDIAPVRKGHALVVTKAHYPDLWSLPADLGGDLLAAMQAVGQAVVSATGAEGLNVGMNNRAAAGQVVPHAHFHLIPRNVGDGLALWPQSSYAGQEEMERLAEAIRARI
ncbi:HIT domain-containing protein [Desulfovibrio aminophilus]|uniref:HIT family protein n=1 Tax=Desulfovibrio aminophilus TaxID=81425 RepID=UPI003390DCFF